MTHLGYLGKPIYISKQGFHILNCRKYSGWIYIDVELMLRGIWYGLRGATRAHAILFTKDGNYYIIELVIVYK
jgi:hypothetical protein